MPHQPIDRPTPLQQRRLETLIAHLGEDRVRQYFKWRCGNGDFDAMTKRQAQAVITGLGPLRALSGERR